MSVQSAGNSLAGNIRAAMARQRRKAVDLAEALHMSQPAVSRRLSGETGIDIDELCAIAKWLDVPVTDLLIGVDGPGDQLSAYLTSRLSPIAA